MNKPNQDTNKLVSIAELEQGIMDGLELFIKDNRTRFDFVYNAGSNDKADVLVKYKNRFQEDARELFESALAQQREKIVEEIRGMKKGELVEVKGRRLNLLKPGEGLYNSALDDLLNKLENHESR